MAKSLMEAIGELSVKMRLVRARHEAGSDTEDLRDREVLLLELLNDRGKASVSEVCRFFPGVGQSTISTDITRLWRDRGLVSKVLDPTDQRSHTVELTEEGQQKVAEIKERRAKVFGALADLLGTDPGELAVLKRVVERAIAGLDRKLSEVTRNEEDR